MAANYAISKLSEMQRRMVEERRDRENLRRRFAQNQDDCTFTVLALLPTLGDQLFSHMDVEGLTAKLQRGRQVSSGARSPAPAAQDAPYIAAGMNGDAVNGGTDTSTHSAQKIVEISQKSDGDEARKEQQPAQDAMEEAWNRLGGNQGENVDGLKANDGKLGQARGSKAENDTPDNYSEGEATRKEPIASNGTTTASNGDSTGQRGSGLDAVAEPIPRPIPPEARLTPSPSPSFRLNAKDETTPQSELGTNISSGTEKLNVNSEPVESSNGQKPTTKAEVISPSTPQTGPQTFAPSSEDILEEKRAKLALWNELKVTAIARTITSLYGVVLLSLQTSVQLNLLGRYAYLTSVSSLSSTDSANHRIRIERHDGQVDIDDDRSDDQHDEERMAAGNDALMKGIDVNTERLFLTLSWWFLHRGWRQLADIVQEAVKDVFGDVALKSTLTHADFVVMLRKVRRRVEYETRSVGGEDGMSVLGASFASFDARSEFSEATTGATGTRGLRRGRRRNFSAIIFPPAQEEVQTLIDAGALPATSVPPGGASLEALSPTLPALLDETRDIVESDDFWRIMRLSLRSVFAVFENSMRPAFGLGPAPTRNNAGDLAEDHPLSLDGPPSSGAPVQPTTPQNHAIHDSGDEVGKPVRLAGLFPAVARQSTTAIHGAPNEYVEALANVKELRAFCAVIYSAWS